MKTNAKQQSAENKETKMSTIKSVFAFIVLGVLGLSLCGMFVSLALNNGADVVLCIMALMITVPLFLMSETWL